MGRGVLTIGLLLTALFAISAAMQSYPSSQDGDPKRNRRCAPKDASLVLNFGYTGSFGQTQFDYEATICAMVRAGFKVQSQLKTCAVDGPSVNKPAGQNIYKMVTVQLRVWLENYYVTSDKIPSFFDVNDFAAAARNYQVQLYPQTVEFADINECTRGTHKCSPNAKCYNTWGTYRCKCNDGREDQSDERDCPGTVCEYPRTDKPWFNRKVWVYALIGVAIVVLLMLIFCYCCFYSGSIRSKPKVVKQVVAAAPYQPAFLPVQQPECNCPPQEEKKIIIQLENVTAPAPAVPVAMQPHSAFIANVDGYDGNVYVSSGATRALPWSGGSNLVSTTTPADQVAYVQEEPQTVYLQEEQPVYGGQEPMYIVQ